MNKTNGVTGLLFMKGHSARVPRKNLRDFAGKPLCQWITQTLLDVEKITQIIVNTDSNEIAEMCSVDPKVKIHMRPQHLLGDRVTAMPLIDWDLRHSEGEIYLQTHSTNPLLTVSTIERAIAAFNTSNDADSLFTVTPQRKRYFWENGTAINHDPNHLIPTQELPPVFEENSCIYIFSKQSFIRCGKRIGSKPIMFPMDALEGIDIDEEHEFLIAETLMRHRQGKSSC
jgi:N-acylneuraminate cytidylyltransferase